jgi:acyl-coenzyme A synthetase/AMP-(fatty) acid ligase
MAAPQFSTKASQSAHRTLASGGEYVQGDCSFAHPIVPLSAHHVSTAAQVIQQYNVNALLTAPTALRAIVREDPKAEFMTKYDLTKYGKCASNQVAACACTLIFLGRDKWH